MKIKKLRVNYFKAYTLSIISTVFKPSSALTVILFLPLRTSITFSKEKLEMCLAQTSHLYVFICSAQLLITKSTALNSALISKTFKAILFLKSLSCFMWYNEFTINSPIVFSFLLTHASYLVILFLFLLQHV